MRTLLLNAGSSSLKCSVLESEGGAVLARASMDWAGPVTRYERVGADGERVEEQVAARSHGEAVQRVLLDLDVTSSPPAAVGHRIVHGGTYREPIQITAEVRARIRALAELAPLHNPPGLDALAAAEALLPAVPHVATFDTSFHATLPAAAYTYPLPYEWAEEWGVRRYGFHGLSHAYATSRAAEMLEKRPADLRLVICHLGHGCSASAVMSGRSVDTTMGFTPLDGLMMATRSGSVDPGILTHVQRRRGLAAEQLDTVLNHRSGLLGVSGISGDMREVLAACRSGHARAQLAVDVYAHAVRKAIGALAVTLGGVDALVFTGGVGENAAEIRAASCRGLELLGLELDPDANARCRPDADVARSGGRARILLVAAREDLAMLSDVMWAIAHRSE
jgi:acetate kinase